MDDVLFSSLTIAARRLRAARAIVVNGARQTGKTALLGILHGQVEGTYLSLDSATNLRLARTDPTGFVTGFDEPLFIDEVQRGGTPLILAVKLALDTDSRRGRFVLAGSTRFLTEPRLSESLAGRVRFVDLWPLSQGEIDGAPDGFVDDTDFRGLRMLRDRLGEQFSCGVVVHCGDRPRPFGPGLYAVPVSSIWEAG